MRPSLALANHSCDPSSRREDIDSRAILVMNRAIKLGEEVTVDYLLGRELGKEEKRALLRRDYWFSCTCSRCKDVDDDF